MAKKTSGEQKSNLHTVLGVTFAESYNIFTAYVGILKLQAAWESGKGEQPSGYVVSVEGFKKVTLQARATSSVEGMKMAVYLARAQAQKAVNDLNTMIDASKAAEGQEG